MRRFLSILVATAMCLAGSAALAGKTDAMFTVEGKATPAALAPGQKGTAELAIRVKKGAHISDEAPFKGTLVSKGVTVEKDTLAKSDGTYEGGSATFRVPFTAGSEKGAASIDGTLAFYICSQTLCEAQKRAIRIPVTVH